jgi:hypothetical protein
MTAMATKGKWQQGIVPRNFFWIIKDRLAVCERPGGYGDNHRKVRRQEEIIWVREQGFTTVISVIPAPHNLHNYDELGVVWQHWPFTGVDDTAGYLATAYPRLRDLLDAGAKLLVHGEELGDRVCGLMAGYLLWSGLVDTGPNTITVLERMTQRQLGPHGREVVAIAERMRGQG